MKRLFSYLIGAFLLTSLCPAISHGHEDGEATTLRHWEIASSDPDRIFLSFCGDPATSRAVTWRTDRSVLGGFAEIGKANGSPKFTGGAQRVRAVTEALDMNQARGNEQGTVHYHSVVFENLEPETMYAYRVGDGREHWSEWIQFKTASTEEKPFSFLYFGDAQNNLLSMWSRVMRMAYQVAPDASFAIHAGDLVNSGHMDREWAEWFKAGSFLHSQLTGVPVIGNHEYRKLDPAAESEFVMSLLWRPQFTLPIEAGVPEELHETVYSFDYQGLQVIVLDSNGAIEAQARFLEEQLSKEGFRWRVVTYHHSLYSPNGRSGYKYEQMFEKWKPLFEKYHVDLVLQGHDHAYARGQEAESAENGEVSPSSKPVYITTVSGPKQYDINMEALEKFEENGFRTLRTGKNTQFFQVIRVDGNELIYEAYTAVGELYDRFSIVK